MSDYEDYAANRDWLQDNREKYQGQWVVLKGGKLIAWGNDYTELSQRYGSHGNWIVKVI